ncbi:MAG: 30S ribosome-binding factor RbfA [Bacteroidia bacterium]
MESRRQAKVSKLLQRELAVILQKNGKSWFAIPFITVSQVRVTPDLSYAKVYLTFLGDDNPEDKVKLVRTKTAEVKRQLASALRHEMRKLPEINFFYDDTLDYADNMNKLLDSLKPDDSTPSDKE